jgi:hypothetical protein
MKFFFANFQIFQDSNLLYRQKDSPYPFKPYYYELIMCKHTCNHENISTCHPRAAEAAAGLLDCFAERTGFVSASAAVQDSYGRLRRLQDGMVCCFLSNKGFNTKGGIL